MVKKSMSLAGADRAHTIGTALGTVAHAATGEPDAPRAPGPIWVFIRRASPVPIAARVREYFIDRRVESVVIDEKTQLIDRWQPAALACTINLSCLKVH